MSTPIALAFYLFAPTFAMAGSNLNLDQFLEQVSSTHDGLKASKAISKAATMRTDESKLLTRPRLTAQFQNTIDERPQIQPAFQGNRTIDQLYRIGIEEQTTFGLAAKLSYQFNYRQIDGANPNFIPRNSFYLGTPVLELSQQLLKNGFGSEITAQVELGQAAAQATAFEQSFRSRMILMDARAAYWRTAVAQQIVTAQQGLLDRARKMSDWSNRRVNLQLADKADGIQADALVQVRELELKNAIDELKNSARLLNSLRGEDSDQIAETLVGLDTEVALPNLDTLKSSTRDDVRQAQQISKIASAQAKLGEEKNRSQLEVYGAYALNSLESEANPGWSNSWSTRNPTTTVGVRFATPLDFSLAGKTKEAYASEGTAAESVYQRRLIDQRREAEELSFQINSAHQRIAILKQIEATQERKLKNERDRLFRGRSTTFQVLQFEQDASLAQVNRIRTQGELMTLLARLELYKEGDLP